MNNDYDNLKREVLFLKSDLRTITGELATAKEELARVTADRDNAQRHDEQMNLALGRLAPKGTWLCEVLEYIWRADSTDEAQSIADANQRKIEEAGLFVGPRIEEARAAAVVRAETAEARCRVKDACLEYVRTKLREFATEGPRFKAALEEIHKALGTDGKVLTTQDSIAKRALADLATERARADKAEKERDEAARVADEAVRNIISIRCIDHIHIPQQNKNEITGAECGACIAAQRDAATIRADRAEAACAAMKSAIGANVRNRGIVEYLREFYGLTKEGPGVDYFRNLTASTETSAGEALLERLRKAEEDTKRLDWVLSHVFIRVALRQYYGAIFMPEVNRESIDFAQAEAKQP